MGQQADTRLYRDAVFAVYPGASNLVSLARELISEMYPAIKEELGEEDNLVEDQMNQLAKIVAHLEEKDMPTKDKNTYPAIKIVVKVLYDWAFDSAVLRRIPYHPIFRLMISQMRELAQVPDTADPLSLTRWSDAYETCISKSEYHQKENA